MPSSNSIPISTSTTPGSPSPNPPEAASAPGMSNANPNPNANPVAAAPAGSVRAIPGVSDAEFLTVDMGAGRTKRGPVAESDSAKSAAAVDAASKAPDATPPTSAAKAAPPAGAKRGGRRDRLRAAIAGMLPAPRPDEEPLLPAEEVPWYRRKLSRTEAQALVFSVGVHALVLLVTTLIVTRGESKDPEAVLIPVVDTAVVDIDRIELEATSLAAVGGMDRVAAGNYAPNLGENLEVANPVAEKPVEMPNVTASLANIPLPQAENVNVNLDIRGSGAEHVGGSEEAVDRIAQEIMRKLESGPTLVVWAMDASGSLHEERQRLVRHIVKVYENVLQLDSEGLSANDGLLTSVVAFGKDRQILIDRPTADVDSIRKAIEGVPLDKTGYESTFATVVEIARHFGRYQRDKLRYQPMCVILTDEVGDDEDRLEAAIQASRTVRMPVYVLGSAALFGQTIGMVEYTDPETGQYYPALPVRQGPESIRNEMINLPFWYPSGNTRHLDSGFGPYALSRLCGATGGIYFITRLGATKVQFDPARMLEYRPDWLGVEEYEAMLRRSPLRMAVVQAGQATQQRIPDAPGLVFPAAGTEQFREAMRENQARADRIRLVVDDALGPIRQVEKLRDRETSKRWQAHYDLIRGRLEMMRVRAFEYNKACAEMKVNPKKFTNENSNAWRLVPDDQVQFNDQARKSAELAVELLRRVTRDHAGTPWAYLANRELENPIGFKWEETYVQPPARMENNNNNNNKKAMNQPRPPDPPKI